MRKHINLNRFKHWKKIGRRFGITIATIFLILIIGLPSFQWLIDYIWMDTLGFGSVYTTILTSKLVLAGSGFILFFAAHFATLFWIRKTYLNHFDDHQLPPLVVNRRASMLAIFGIAILSGFIGSLIVQGIGWEPALKFIHHNTFDIVDPYFSKDVSFYMFVLPFIQFI